MSDCFERHLENWQLAIRSSIIESIVMTLDDGWVVSHGGPLLLHVQNDQCDVMPRAGELLKLVTSSSGWHVFAIVIGNRCYRFDLEH